MRERIRSVGRFNWILLLFLAAGTGVCAAYVIPIRQSLTQHAIYVGGKMPWQPIGDHVDDTQRAVVFDEIREDQR